MNNEYYESLGIIYESYEEGLISEETKDTLINKLKKAKNKVKDKIKSIDKKKLAKNALKVGAVAGLAYAAPYAAAYGAKKANDKLNKDFDVEQRRKELKATAKQGILKDRKAGWSEWEKSLKILSDPDDYADLKNSEFRGVRKILRKTFLPELYK